MGFSIDSFIWNAISKKPCVVFAEESGSAALWVVIVLLLRTLLVVTRTESFVPQGLVYAFPFIIQMLSKYIPLWRRRQPMLTVRLAESLLGRVSASTLLVLVPAHLLGAVFGLVLFKTLLPFAPNEVFAVFPEKSHWWVQTLVTEIAIHFIYTTTMLVLPHLLSINRLTTKLTSLPIVPLFLCVPSSSFHPALLYALWYVHNCTAMLAGFASLHIERLLGPLIGAVLAGLFCNVYFPDDPQSWTRSKQG